MDECACGRMGKPLSTPASFTTTDGSGNRLELILWCHAIASERTRQGFDKHIGCCRSDPRSCPRAYHLCIAVLSTRVCRSVSRVVHVNVISSSEGNFKKSNRSEKLFQEMNDPELGSFLKNPCRFIPEATQK